MSCFREIESRRSVNEEEISNEEGKDALLLHLLITFCPEGNLNLPHWLTELLSPTFCM